MPILTGRKDITGQIIRHYKELVRVGKARPGEKLPTTRELAAQLSISIGPVEKAFSALETEGIVSRRRGLGTFVRDVGRRPPETLEVGVVFRAARTWNQGDNYALLLFHGIQDALQAQRHRMSLFTLSARTAEEVSQSVQDEIVRRFSESPAHGFILDELTPDYLVARLAATDRPVVMVNRASIVPGTGAAVRDNAQAGEEAARRFLASGHRVAACLHRLTWNGLCGASGFLRVMAEAGHALPAERVAAFDPRKPAEVLCDEFRRLMTSVPVSTAIYCTDDRLAEYVYRFAAECGLRIPEHLSVAGTLDLPMDEQMSPPLASFRLDPEAIGRAAADEVTACCLEPGRKPGIRMIGGEWVDRASLAPIS